MLNFISSKNVKAYLIILGKKGWGLKIGRIKMPFVKISCKSIVGIYRFVFAHTNFNCKQLAILINKKLKRWK